MNHSAYPSKQHYRKSWGGYLLVKTGKISVKRMLNTLRDDNEKTWKLALVF